MTIYAKPYRIYQKSKDGQDSMWLSSHTTKEEANRFAKKANDPFDIGEDNGYFVIRMHSTT